MINIAETFRSAFVALTGNKIRSGLTMLGVIIGVAAVILLISLGKGIQNYITDQFEALGSNLLFVSPGQADFASDPAAQFSRNELDEEHVELIERYASDFITDVTPYITASAGVKYKTNTFNASVNATNERGFDIVNFEVDEGRYFTGNEVRSKAKVVLLGKEVKDELFPTQSAIGQRIKLDTGETLTVIGTIKPKGQNFDNAIAMPHTTAMDIFEIENYSSITAKAKEGVDVDQAIRKIELALMRDLDEDEFTVMSQEDILSSIQSILQVLTIGLGAIAAISLVVGGIGIMNIMLVSVTERTREIGLRKAIGAAPADIASQFLIESMLLSMGGGIIGIIIGWLLSFGGRAFIRTEVPLWSVLLAFSFAAFVGIIFGTYPAIKASKKDPIEALRYE